MHNRRVFVPGQSPVQTGEIGGKVSWMSQNTCWKEKNGIYLTKIHRVIFILEPAMPTFGKNDTGGIL